MSDAVLDASAVIAALNGEPGADVVDAIIARSSISAVNICEVVTKLIERGFSDVAIRNVMDALPARVEPFDAAQAYSAGMLRSATRHLGLSLGDRCCLGLAQSMRLPVLTSERSWARLQLGVHIQVIR